MIFYAPLKSAGKRDFATSTPATSRAWSVIGKTHVVHDVVKRSSSGTATWSKTIA
jgi:hypothetical protein